MFETKTALFAIEIQAKEFFNCTVHLNVDNASTLSWIKKQTAPNENNFKIVQNCKNSLGFLYSDKYLGQNPYTAFKHNKVADKESRKVHDNLHCV